MTVFAMRPPAETNSMVSLPPGDALDDDPEVQLNVGGVLFVTRQSTINRQPGTLLTEMTTQSPYYHGKSGEYRFDRDPDIFGHILNFYRWGELHVPGHVCPMGFRKELEFWQIQQVHVSTCCWKRFYKVDNEMETMNTLKDSFPSSSSTLLTSETAVGSGEEERLSLTMKIWLFLDDPNFSYAATMWHYVYLFFVILSALVYTLWMVPGLRVDAYIGYHTIKGDHANDKIHDLVDTDPHVALLILDNICTLVFVIEFLLHYGVCPNKVAFLMNCYNTLNMVLVLLMIVSFILELRKDLITSEAIGVVYYVLKNCSVFRLLLLFRLEKRYVGLKILLLSIKDSARQLLLLGLTLLVAVTIFAGLMFCAELDEESFPTIFTAMWWAVITMTTVGYGDFTPVDFPGYIIGSMCAICGLLIIALPIAVIASNFADYYECRDLHDKYVKASKNELASKQNVQNNDTH